jgi:hypothetical protein
MPKVRVQVKHESQVFGAFGVSINRRKDEVIVGELTEDELDVLRKQLSKGGRNNAT